MRVEIWKPLGNIAWIVNVQREDSGVYVMVHMNITAEGNMPIMFNNSID